MNTSYGHYGGHKSELANLLKLKKTLEHANYPLLGLGLIAVLLNVILIFLTSSLLSRHRLSWKRFYLILNNSIMDACVACVLVASRSVQVARNAGYGAESADMETTSTGLMLIESMLVITPAVYFLSLCFIQYVAIRYPLAYATRVTKRMCRVIVAIQWTLVVAYALSLSLVYVYVTQRGTSSREQGNFSLGHDVKIVNEVIMMVLLAFFIVAVSATYTLVFIARVKKVRGIERTLDQFVKNFGFNVLIYLVSAIAVLIIGIMQLPASMRYASLVRGGENAGLSGDNDIDRLLEQLAVYMRLQTARTLANFVWLSRIVLEPLLLIGRNVIIKRYLMMNMRSICTTSVVHGQRFLQPASMTGPQSHKAALLSYKVVQCDHAAGTHPVLSGVSRSDTRKSTGDI